MNKSMEELIREMEEGKEQMRIRLVGLGAEDDPTSSFMPLVEDRVYMNYFEHFPSKLPGTDGRTQESTAHLGKIAEAAGKSLEEFQKDIRTAISTSGVDITALTKYIDRVLNEGLSNPATAKSYKELIVPVYLQLRKMGYSHKILRA